MRLTELRVVQRSRAKIDGWRTLRRYTDTHAEPGKSVGTAKADFEIRPRLYHRMIGPQSLGLQLGGCSLILYKQNIQ